MEPEEWGFQKFGSWSLFEEFPPPPQFYPIFRIRILVFRAPFSRKITPPSSEIPDSLYPSNISSLMESIPP